MDKNNGGSPKIRNAGNGRPIIFGITGGTGAGKSTVSSAFRDRGIYVADADAAARQVVKKDMPCLSELKDAFGSRIITGDGELDRRRLGEIVFSDSRQLEILNRITHKYIKAYLEDEIAGAGAAIAAIDGAVIIGSPVMDICEFLVVVTADESVRKERIMRRDGISREAAEKRINAQLPQSEYLKHADFVIDNSENGEKQEREIEEILSKIKAYKAK